MTKFCLISDTHNLHDQIKIPECEFLIHAGDFSGRGTVPECASFFNWFSVQPAKFKLAICGNHDKLAQKDPNLFKSLIPSNVIYLQDNGVEIDGIKFYGTPWQPYFYDWAFNGLESRGIQGFLYNGGPGLGVTPDRDHPYLYEVYGKIPDDTNVLICHGPPRYGNLDNIPYNREDDKAGSFELFTVIQRLKDLKLGVFGHFHSGYGVERFDKALLCNAALLNENYKVANKPVELDEQDFIF